jgi:hypothetical protein
MLFVYDKTGVPDEKTRQKESVSMILVNDITFRYINTKLIK